MKDDKCSECIAYESTEYINPFHVVGVCHQGSTIIRNLSVAEECECFEKIDGEDK